MALCVVGSPVQVKINNWLCCAFHVETREVTDVVHRLLAGTLIMIPADSDTGDDSRQDYPPERFHGSRQDYPASDTGDDSRDCVVP